ncbi:MAG: SDR family NAD(P)-dependent oxidoreductase [Glaciimonas sp.]|nr:SDR family NAD(P)-dependent oxidoreductase [Glaciimonas sp.]
MAPTTSKSAITEKPVWFITGCSTGFGRELAKHVLERGYRTVVTARNPDELNDLAAMGECSLRPGLESNHGNFRERSGECFEIAPCYCTLVTAS